MPNTQTKFRYVTIGENMGCKSPCILYARSVTCPLRDSLKFQFTILSHQLLTPAPPSVTCINPATTKKTHPGKSLLFESEISETLWKSMETAHLSNTPAKSQKGLVLITFPKLSQIFYFRDCLGLRQFPETKISEKVYFRAIVTIARHSMGRWGLRARGWTWGGSQAQDMLSSRALCKSSEECVAQLVFLGPCASAHSAQEDWISCLLIFPRVSENLWTYLSVPSVFLKECDLGAQTGSKI